MLNVMSERLSSDCSAFRWKNVGNFMPFVIRLALLREQAETRPNIENLAYLPN